MARRDPFARARGFLDFLPVAKWTAIVAGIATGIFCLLLLVFLAFLVDLLFNQGGAPSFADYPPAEREAWQEAVAYMLRERVSSEAAGRYLDYVRTPPPARYQQSLGILGLVIRCRDRWDGVAFAWLARRAPGLWQLAGQEPNVTYLIRLGVLIGVTLLLLTGCQVVVGLSANRAAAEAGARLRRAVYQHTFRRGSLAIRAQGPSEAVSVFTRHVESVQDGLDAWLASWGRPFLVLLFGVFALAVSPWLGLGFLCLALLVLGIIGRAADAQARREQAAVQKAAQQLALMQEGLRLIRLVKCYLMDQFSQQRMDRQLAAYSRYDQRRRVAETMHRALSLCLIALALAVWLGFAVWLVLTQRVEAVEAVLATMALVALFLAGIDLRARLPAIQRGQQSAVALFEFLDQPSDVGQEVGADALPPLSHQLELDNVSMREPGGTRMLLEEISLRIPAGRRVGVVGPDDREKHALACLLPRFLDPTAGEIRVDEHNLRWVSLESLRGQIGLVLRHNLIFNDSVLQNIGCGSATAKLPQITEAAKLAHAHQFIQKLPKGYETVIGELGYPLDIGEQYRIALARAILRQPTMLIIEEPPAADLDSDTLALLDDTYNRILTGRTVLFLPHRLATLRTCDHLILLHHGRIEAAGNHRDLLAASEYYQHLHYVEFNPFSESS